MFLRLWWRVNTAKVKCVGPELIVNGKSLNVSWVRTFRNTPSMCYWIWV